MIKLEITGSKSILISSFLITLSILVIAYLSIGLLFDYHFMFFFNSPNSAGELGDFLGGTIGTLIGLFTLILVYQTYRSQKQELKEQRIEFKRTRNFDIIYKEIEKMDISFKKYHNAVNMPNKSIEDVLNTYLENYLHEALNYNKEEGKSLVEMWFLEYEELFELINLLESILKRLEIISSVTRDDEIDEYDKILLNSLPNKFISFIYVVKYSLKLIDNKELEAYFKILGLSYSRLLQLLSEVYTQLEHRKINSSSFEFESLEN